MINNIKDLFLKYNSNLNTKKDTKETVLNIFKKRLNLDLKDKNVEIDTKNKKIYIKNIRSSLRFFISSRLDQDTLEDIKKRTGYNISNL